MHHPTKRSQALLVTDAGLGAPSGAVRMGQFRDHFEHSSDWQAAYITRRVRLVEGVLSRLHAWHLVVLQPMASRGAQWLLRRREDEIVRRARHKDLVYISKVPSLELVKRIRAAGRTKVVLDINDGLWLPVFRRSGWNDLEPMLSEVDAVIAENSHLADFALRHNDRVYVVPDAPQVEAFDKVRASVSPDPSRITLGWLGSPQNADTLLRVWEALEQLAERHPSLHLRIVGAGPERLPRFEKVDWSCRVKYSQSEMVSEALAFDFGLFPLYRTQDGLARGSLKAKIYMSGGAVAVCEDYGECSNLVVDGVNGVLASQTLDWVSKIDRLIKDVQERKAVAARGLALIRSQFSAAGTFNRLTGVFNDVLGNGADAPLRDHS